MFARADTYQAPSFALNSIKYVKNFVNISINPSEWPVVAAAAVVVVVVVAVVVVEKLTVD